MIDAVPATIDAATWGSMRRPCDRRIADAIALLAHGGRKALVVVVGEDGSSGRILDMDGLKQAVAEGLDPTARAGGGQKVMMADVIAGYETGREIPVLFVDEEDGAETLDIFLYRLE